MDKQIKTAIIGCGSFVNSMHIPNMLKNPKFKIHACVDINESAAKETCKKTGAEYWTGDIDRILKDKNIDLVVITTRHNTHAGLTVQAANAGKHILCEKPMAMNIEECHAVSSAVKKNNVKYTVGYNRGIAPLIKKAKELLTGDSHKKMIYHRIQAPFPADSWTHIPEIGGGRFIGEGCHIFDLLCEITETAPVSVYAAGGTFLDPDKVKISDSGIITIFFGDGSVGTTLISSAGCSAFPKEATEIYCNGKVIYINNFTDFEYYPGTNGAEKYSKQDKGQADEIDLLADSIINDTQSPNGINKAARAAIISFKVNESIAGMKPVQIKETEYNLIS